MERKKMPNYDRMSVDKLREVYVERCREMNSYEDKNAPTGRYKRQKVTRADEEKVFRTKTDLVIAIRELDIRLHLGELADIVDKQPTGKSAVLIISGGRN